MAKQRTGIEAAQRMMAATEPIKPEQRFTRKNPCPVCGGGKDDPHQQGIRCWGYGSEDGELAFCTREDYAGKLQPRELTDGQKVREWAHRLTGECKCGVAHAPEVAPAKQLKAPPISPVVAEYVYQNEEGKLVRRKLRTAAKDFYWQHPQSSAPCCIAVPPVCKPAQDGWRWGKGGQPAILYNLPSIANANPSKTVIVAEGDKDADRLIELGFLATCSDGGAGTWRAEDSEPLRGRRGVIILEDNDDDGRGHVAKVAEALQGLVGTIKVVALPGLKEHGDVSDWLDDGHTKEEFKEVVRSTSAWQRVAGPVVLTLANVEREEVVWLWKDRIALGKLTMEDGDPGAGKSWQTLAITAAVTNGAALPGETTTHPPANVLILSAEDGAADTIRPRLEDMGADLNRVKVLVAMRDAEGRERNPTLVEDMLAIDEILADGSFTLLIIDPINAYLGGDVDTHRDAAVRAVLTPLASLAARRDVAIVAVRHLTKGGRDKAIYRGQGSIAYTAAARVVHLIGENPKVPGERVMVCTKNNLAPIPAPLAFEIKDGKFVWLGLRPMITAEELLAPAKATSAREKAEDFLYDLLRDESKSSEEILAASPVSENTLKRAKRDLGIESYREGSKGSQGGGAWYWKLPEDEEPPSISPKGELDIP